MRFISTRGRAPSISFREAVLSGLAPDGGLYVPAVWPQVPDADRAALPGKSFAHNAARILASFAGPDLPEPELRDMAERAFGAFDTPEVAPLREIGDEEWLLELFHGPTLAFKDIAMRMLAQLYDWALAGKSQGKTIIGATSGDTGGAAIHAFAGSASAEIFMLHPHGRISAVQRRMMSTVDAPNIVNIAVDGTFDDCQRLVKALFADSGLNRDFDLGGVNSINWVRLAVQTVYYFTTTATLGMPVSFVVPTGNFGDVFAGYAATRMGLPAGKFGVAVNQNDIMRRVLRSGEYSPASATATTSPSMDIQVASNFERLLFEVCDRDSAALCRQMGGFERDGRMRLPDPVRRRLAEDFVAESADDEEVAAMISAHYEDKGLLIDPHTAVGLVALSKLRRSGEIEGPAVCLATAHPAKFPEAVGRASGVTPRLPKRYEDLMTRAERLVPAPADIAAIREIIEQNSIFGGKS
jgi:threonine synthase